MGNKCKFCGVASKKPACSNCYKRLLIVREILKIGETLKDLDRKIKGWDI